MNSLNVIGSGGGGKGGSQGGGVSEDPDTLSSVANAKFIDLIGEGEIVGLVNGESSIYLDGVPLRSLSGTANYKPFQWSQTKGTQAQVPMAGFLATEQDNAVSVQLLYTTGKIIRTISDSDADAVRVTVSVNGLSLTTTQGQIGQATVYYKISVRQTSGSWVVAFDGSIQGKTRSKYQRSHEIDLTNLGVGPYQVAVERVAPDSTSSLLVDAIYWDSYTVINYERLAYPNSALVGVQVDARYFSSVPARSYHVKGLLVKVPSNYNPVSRQYSGVWNGTFVKAYTNNPVWCFYNLLTNTRYGAGKRVTESMVNKWALYSIAQYCDEMVPTGQLIEATSDLESNPTFGVDGTAIASIPVRVAEYEPRFALNVVLDQQEDAYKVLNNLASVFRGMSYWMGGQINVFQDAPAEPSILWTNANVIGGSFNYEGSARAQRHTVVMVAWNDPKEDFKQKYEYVEDREGILRYGVRSTDIVAFGCTSQSQARRAGLWLLFTERMESDAIKFQVGLDSANVKPGDIGQIMDARKVGARWGGRILSATSTGVTLDAPVTLAAGTYTLNVMGKDGTVVPKSVVIPTPGTFTDLTVTVPFSSLPANMAIWTLASTVLNPKLVRVVGFKQLTATTFEVLAVSHEPGKYSSIERGQDFVRGNYSFLSYKNIPAVTNLVALEETYKVPDTGVTYVAINASWDTINDPLIRGYKLKVRAEDGTVLTDTEVSSAQYVETKVSPQTYTIEVAGVNYFGMIGSYTSTPIVVLGIDDSPPSNVTGFAFDVDDNGLHLKWNKPDDKDWAFTILKLSGTEFFRGKVTSFTAAYQVPGTYPVSASHANAHSQSASPANLSVVVSAPAAPILAPVGVQGLNAQFSWSNSKTTNPIDFYEVRVGLTSNTFADATPVTKVSGNTQYASYVDTTGGTRRVFVRATDKSGSVSNVGTIDFTTSAISGLNNSVVSIYRRSTTTLTSADLPSATTTYTFAGGTLAGLTNGWTTSVPAGTDPLWLSVASASSANPTDTIGAGEWASPVLFVQNGTAAPSSATVFLYQRTAVNVTPALPSAAVTYTFATGGVTGLTNGWTKNVPTSGGGYLWVTTATALSTTATDSIASTEWAPAALLAQDGASGIAGAFYALSITVYKQAATVPPAPVGGSYTFTGNVFVAPSGWSRDMPTSTTTPTWASTFLFETTTPTIPVVVTGSSVFVVDSNTGLLLHGIGADGGTTITDSGPLALTPLSVGAVTTSTAMTLFGESTLRIPKAAPLVYNPITAFNISGINFRMRMWYYELSTSLGGLICRRTDTQPNGWILHTAGVRAKINGTYSDTQMNWTRPSFNAWHYLEWSVNAGTMRVFIDGVLVATKTGVSSIEDLAAYGLYIGQSSHVAENRFDGYIKELQFEPGVAGSTSNYSVPTASSTGYSGMDSNTLLLLHNDTSSIVDSSSRALALTNAGGVTITGSNPSSFSTQSLLFSNASGSYVAAPTGAYFNVGTGPMVARGWIYPTDLSVENYFCGRLNTAVTGSIEYCFYLLSDRVTVYRGTRGTNQERIDLLFPANIALNTWSHVAVQRASNGDWSCYLNGVRGIQYRVSPLASGITYGAITTGTYNNAANFGNDNSSFTVGSTAGLTSVNRFRGQLDEFAFEAKQVYTGDFTPETRLYSSVVASGAWSDPPVKVFQASNGSSSALVHIYKRSATVPALPTATVTYDFATAAITGLTNGWTAAPPAGTDPLYLTVATAASSTGSDTIAPAEWVSPARISGTDGAAGGLNNASVFLFKRTTDSTTPALPSADVTYTFATGIASGLTNGWSQTLPTTGGPYRWMTNSAALSTASTDTILTTEWAVPAVLAQDGGGSPLITLQSTSDVFMFASNGMPSPLSQTITFTAVPSNLSGTATFTATFYDADGTNLGYSVTMGGTGNVRTLTESQFGAAKFAVIVASLGGYTDQITITRVQDGSNSYSWGLTNESAIVAAYANGTVPSFSTAGGQFHVRFGSTLITTGITYSVLTATDVTINIDASGNYYVTALSADNGIATLRATITSTGVNLDRIYTISKSKQGVRGTVQIVVTTTGTAWSDSAATAGIVSQTGSNPIDGDQVTLWNSSANFSQSRYYLAGSWLTLDQYLNGGVLLPGSVGSSPIGANAVSSTTSATAYNWGAVNLSLTITASDIALGETDASVTIIASQDVLYSTYFDVGVNPIGGYLSPGGLLAAQPPVGGVFAMAFNVRLGVGTHNIACWNHGVGNTTDPNTRIRTVVATINKR